MDEQDKPQEASLEAYQAQMKRYARVAQVGREAHPESPENKILADSLREAGALPLGKVNVNTDDKAPDVNFFY